MKATPLNVIRRIAHCVADRLFARHAAIGGRKFCEPLERRTLLTVPVISNFNFNYETTHSLTLNVSPNMLPGAPGVTDGLTDTDLIVEKVGTDTNVPEPSILLNYNGTNPATFRFTNIEGSPNPNGTILSDGNYRASISKQDLVHGMDEMADDAVHDFFVFAGDLTGGPGGTRDRRVNLADFNILAANFGMTGATYSQGDLNYDGIVSLPDFNRLAGNFGATMPQPPTASDAIEVGAATSSSLTVMRFDNVIGETGYRIQQSSNGQTFDVYYNDTTGSGVFRSFQVPNLQDGSRYWFRVRAYSDPLLNPNGPNTAYTPKRGGNTILPPPQVTSVTALSSSQTKVEFTDQSQNATSFQVERSLSAATGFAPVGNPIPASATLRFIDFGLSPNTTYYYRVVASSTVTSSSPSNALSAPTQPATAFIDLDVFEDMDGNFIHDNSSAAEQLENTQPTALPFDAQEDGDFAQLVLIVAGAVPGATVRFDYSPGQLQLYRDLWGLYPINDDQEVPLGDFTISGSGTAVLCAKANTTEQPPGGVIVTLGGGSAGSNAAFQGGTRRQTQNSNFRPDDPAWHDNVPDNYGGLDDGDGPEGDDLTDRDGIWTTHQGKRTLIIGFAGHTQSRGKKDIEGQIWRIENRPDRIVGAYQIGQRIRDSFGNWAVTMFPEDPGNADATWTDWCGDGVIGKANPKRGFQRIDATQPIGQPTGALPFLIDAIKNRNVNRVGLFGYSHGAGAVDILIEALVSLANEDGNLRTRLTNGSVRFFWSAYIDGVDVELIDLPQGQFDARGRPAAEQSFPFTQITGFQVPPTGTLWHYNAWQHWTIPFFRDWVTVAGTELDPQDWIDGQRNPNYLRQDYAESANPLGLWPNGTDHTKNAGRGIAENTHVQDRLYDSLAIDALNNTF